MTKTVKIEGKTYTLKKISGYDLTKVTQGLDNADALLKLLVRTVEGLDEKTAKSLDPHPYIALSNEVQEFLGIGEADIKKLSAK